MKYHFVCFYVDLYDRKVLVIVLISRSYDNIRKSLERIILLIEEMCSDLLLMKYSSELH
jgi:uncharacterized protein YlxP (DUF503 family)